jgi:hypothetical protein
MKTAELEGDALDYWVAVGEGAYFRSLEEFEGASKARRLHHAYSTHWSCGGPIIDRADIWMSSDDTLAEGHPFIASCHPHSNNAIQAGPTKLIAAMRAYVASKFGAEVAG